MKSMILVATLALAAATANAHPMTEHGNITVLTEDQLGLGIGSAVESAAPGAVPNGLIWYVVNGVQDGDDFTIVADDGQEPQVIGTADECPGPEWEAHLLANPGDAVNILLTEFWVLCNYIPDFDVYFTGGSYSNRPGDEAGVVPGDGAAVVVLYEGDVGEGFTYTEA